MDSHAGAADDERDSAETGGEPEPRSEPYPLSEHGTGEHGTQEVAALRQQPDRDREAPSEQRRGRRVVERQKTWLVDYLTQLGDEAGGCARSEGAGGAAAELIERQASM